MSCLAAQGGPSTPLCALAPVDFKLVSNAKAESWELFTAGNIRSGHTAQRWPPAHGRLYRCAPEHAAQHTSQLGPAGTHFLPSIVQLPAIATSSFLRFFQIAHRPLMCHLKKGEKVLGSNCWGLYLLLLLVS